MTQHLLKEKIELRKAKHTYSYDPSGFERAQEDYTFPVFTIDDLVIRVDIPHEAEGQAHMVCDCDDYAEKYRKFQAGESYKRQQEKDPDFGWYCVATCEHIQLIKRYLIPHAINTVRELLKDLPPDEAGIAFGHSLEARIFGRNSLILMVEYVEELHKLMTQASY